MPGELIRARGRDPVQRVRGAMLSQQSLTESFIQAQAELTDYAMVSVTMLKQHQKQLELAEPSAAELLNMIATTGAMSIARKVAGFGNGL